MDVLVGLALSDSTSIGTLVIPVWILMRDTLEVRRIVLYLVVISVFYWVLFLLLLAFMTPVATLVESIRLDRSWLWIQLAVGVAWLALGVRVDRRAGPVEQQSSRTRRWRNRILQLDGNRGVVGLALTAGVLEIATMLPLLSAVGMVGRSPLTPFESGLAGSSYVAIMMLPAVVLLAVRFGLGEHGARSLDSSVLMAVGGLVSADAALRLNLTS